MTRVRTSGAEVLVTRVPNVKLLMWRAPVKGSRGEYMVEGVGVLHQQVSNREERCGSC